MVNVYHRWSTPSIVLRPFEAPSTARTALKASGQDRWELNRSRLRHETRWVLGTPIEPDGFTEQTRHG